MGLSGGPRRSSGSLPVLSSSVAKQATPSRPGLAASITKPGLGLIQSGMRRAWLADTQPVRLVWLGSSLSTVPVASAR